MKKYITLVSFMLGICMAPTVPILNSAGTDLGSVSLVITECGWSLYSEAISPEANACHKFKFIDSNDPEGPAIIESPVNHEPYMNFEVSTRSYREILEFKFESMISCVAFPVPTENYASDEGANSFFNNPTFIRPVSVVDVFIPIPRTQDIFMLELDFDLKKGSSIDDLCYIIRKIKTDWKRMVCKAMNKVELAQLQGMLLKYMNGKFPTYPGNRSPQAIKLIEEFLNSEPHINLNWLKQKSREYCKEFKHDAFATPDGRRLNIFINEDTIKNTLPESLKVACDEARSYLESRVSSAT